MGSSRNKVEFYPCYCRVLEFTKKKTEKKNINCKGVGVMGGNQECPHLLPAKGRRLCQVQGQDSLIQSPARNKEPMALS